MSEGKRNINNINKEKAPDACDLCRLCRYHPGWASRRKDNSKIHFDGNKTKTKTCFYTLDDQSVDWD